MNTVSSKNSRQASHLFLRRRFYARLLGGGGALLALTLLLLAVTGCGLFRRAERGTPTPSGSVSGQGAPSGSASGPSVPTSGIVLGVYQPLAASSPAASIDTYDRLAGKKPAFAWLPLTWQLPDGSFRKFDPSAFDQLLNLGVAPGVTWEPSKGSTEAFAVRAQGINQSEFSWKQIISGRYDDYLAQSAQAAAAYRRPIVLRILHEMNGTWYPWAYSVNGNTNVADFVAAWKHIVDIFRKENATNVQFVWCPSAMTAENVQQYGAILKAAYPGDDYVDWLALDGYSNEQNGWRSLQDTFKPMYDLITGFSSRPMIFWEVGAMEKPGDPAWRANWIKQGFLDTIPNQFPKVKVAVWFNSKDGSGRDFALQTSQEALNAWKQVVASPLYQATLAK